MKLNYIILFSLFFIVSLAAGCTSSVKEEMNPIIVSQLNLTDSKKQSLTGSLQGIHQTETGENISLSVHQTLGNERELYVLYDVTFGKEIDISTENNILPDTVTLSGDNDSSFHCAGSVITIEKTPKTITYLSYFSADAKELPETVSLTVGQFKGIPSISEETQTCTWQPTNQGSILSGEITDESAATIGTVLLSPFSLKFDLNSSKQESYDNLLSSLRIVYADGSTKEVHGSVGGSSGNFPLQDIEGIVVFSNILDLSTISGILIDGPFCLILKSKGIKSIG